MNCLCSYTQRYNLQAVTDEQKQIADKVGKECAAEGGLTAEDIQKIRTNPKAAVSDPKAQVNQNRFSHLVSFA